MKKKITNSTLGILTLALIVVGIIFAPQYARVDQTLFFISLSMHVFSWIMITVTVSLFLYTKRVKKVN